MTLITEMSRGASITGHFNHREATGRLFSHLDFVSILAVRYHFRHFLEIAFSSIEQIKMVEVPSNVLPRKVVVQNKTNGRGSRGTKIQKGLTYGEMLIQLFDKGMILVGLLRYLVHPDDGTPDAGVLYPCVLTNPPKNTELCSGDHFYYFATELEQEMVVEVEENSGGGGGGGRSTADITGAQRSVSSAGEAFSKKLSMRKVVRRRTSTGVNSSRYVVVGCWSGGSSGGSSGGGSGGAFCCFGFFFSCSSLFCLFELLVQTSRSNSLVFFVYFSSSSSFFFLGHLSQRRCVRWLQKCRQRIRKELRLKVEKKHWREEIQIQTQEIIVQ